KFADQSMCCGAGILVDQDVHGLGDVVEKFTGDQPDGGANLPQRSVIVGVGPPFAMLRCSRIMRDRTAVGSASASLTAARRIERQRPLWPRPATYRCIATKRNSMGRLC